MICTFGLNRFCIPGSRTGAAFHILSGLSVVLFFVFFSDFSLYFFVEVITKLGGEPGCGPHLCPDPPPTLRGGLRVWPRDFNKIEAEIS